jgi:hypothetical protein
MLNQKTVVKAIFGIVLAILVVSFINVGISLFYPSPKYEDYCQPYIPERLPVENKTFNQPEADKLCYQNFDEAQNKYNRTIFLILAPIGLLLLIIGTLIPNLTLQIMLMGSGFINVVIAIVRNLQEKTSVFIVLGILIIIGILFTIKKLR